MHIACRSARSSWAAPSIGVVAPTFKDQRRSPQLCNGWSFHALWILAKAMRDGGVPVDDQ
jgi:hypothetical protein